MSDSVPAFYRDLVAAVRRHGRGLAGDGHAGWVAIAESWTTFDIARTLVLRGAKTTPAAIAAMDAVAAEIVRNHKALRGEANEHRSER